MELVQEEPKEYVLGKPQKSVRCIEVIEQCEIIGTGTKEDPKRTLVSLVDKSGVVLMSVDPFKKQG